MAKVTLAGQPVDCLLDTGSQVLFVTEAFYKAVLQPQGHLLRSARNWLTLRAADGLEIPYVGYFETTVCIAGVSVDDRAILVVRDSGQQFPGLLGMNVLSHVPQFAACLQEVATTDTFRFARAANKQAIRIPARSSVYVHAVGGRMGQNAKTVKDAYPLPRIDESMDALASARWFSTLDLQSAYTQVPMYPDNQHKTAFSTPFGLYEHRRMAFGLCNAPATFQRLMQTALVV